MTELGNRLKEVRKEKGISLDDLQEMTKIQKRYLKNIEEGKYDSMPGKFYVRAFIKQYAEAVGLQPEELFEEFKNEIPSIEHEEFPEQITRVQTRKTAAPDTVKLMNVLPRIIVVVVIIGILFLLWFIVSSFAGNNSKEKLSSGNSGNVSVQQGDVKSSDKATSENTTGTKNTAKSTKTISTETKKNANQQTGQKLEAISSSGYTSTYKLSGTGQFKLELKAKGGQSWIQVKNSDGSTNFQKLLNDGDSQNADLTKQKQVTITIGNTVNTEVYINGKKLKYDIPASKEVRQVIVIQFHATQTE
ncbi:XRE family transcriptional regulator [Weizmannia acidilactici]|uniref:XRE family transcriptional regulator n=1 Tax=Weizmannia acidilactici TaxID=2607726 RepID=A0A5J4JEI8_9BACI|nr:RodZ domain-containing protein [Weizmannia acidilactici]GER68977.1 XRE family transcriptional regulator [Weizmannia acidilactici]GER72050.1 XRE family transcriptional regulator [Weizmannia acidilactici]